MTTQLWYQYIKRNVDLVFIAGILGIQPPWFETKSKCYRTLWYIYQNFTDFIMYFLTLTNLIGTVLLSNFLDVLSSVPPLIHGIQLSGRLIMLQMQKREFQSYIKDLNDLLLEDIKNPIEEDRTFREIHDSDFKWNLKLTLIEFCSLMAANIIFFIPELVRCFVEPEEAHVIIISWYPYNASISRNKQITNVTHTITWMICNFKMAAFDTLFQSLIILHASQFRQMRYLFGKVIPAEESDVAAFEQSKNQEVVWKLRWWIRQHQNTHSLTKRLQDLYSPLLWFSYMECLLNMCLCAFLATVESPWTPLQRFSAVCIVGTIFMQMFVMCRLGDYVIDSVPEIGFNTSVFRCDKQVRRSMIMILKRSHLPARFSAMKMFYLDSKQYAALFQGVFSYYMALRQLQSRK